LSSRLGGALDEYKQIIAGIAHDEVGISMSVLLLGSAFFGTLLNAFIDLSFQIIVNFYHIYRLSRILYTYSVHSIFEDC